MKKIKNCLNYGVKSILLILAVFIANLSVNKQKLEVTSNANNRVINLSLMSMRLEETLEKDLNHSLETYSGDLTGYSADCPLCNGTLACMPSYNVLNGVDTYIDRDYGKVRIVASSTSMPCGSIVRFSSKLSSEPITAIVLDRGVLGTDLDLLTPNESYASKYVGRSYITYDVLRKGWTRD